MQDEMKLEVTPRLPLQAGPVFRAVVNSAIAGKAGVEPCDNDHNLFVFGCGCGKSTSATGQ
jgi:hypothetical protein